ncbi:SCO family protein [Leptospira sp. 'Mane']|uniref:SCO family protein n=1 Tax=Leptospira sp. 'Mane' TaxID=3387407 RepID=UPI00398A5A05
MKSISLQIWKISILTAFVLVTFNCKNSFSSGDKLDDSFLDLKLVNPDGELLDPKFWTRKKSVLYFGFSHCPDMCPMALTNLGRASLILGDKNKDFQFVFITLDPDRDAPSTLKNYIGGFPGKNLTALSPDLESLGKIANIFGVISKKVKTNESYAIDHSNLIYVIDENLNQLMKLPGGTSATGIATSLRELDSRR